MNRNGRARRRALLVRALRYVRSKARPRQRLRRHARL